MSFAARFNVRRSLVALGLVAFAAGCQIRVGDAADSQRFVSPGDAKYEAARAEWEKKQREFDAAFAEEIAAFHAIEADLNGDDATPAVATAAEELRTRFLKRCIDESGWSSVACWQGTFARDISLALAKIRFRQGDLLDAGIEGYTVKEERDLRPEDEKIWRSLGLSCEHNDLGGHLCAATERHNHGQTERPVLSPEIAKLTYATTDHDKPVDWMGGRDLLNVTRNGAGAMVSFRPWQSGASEGRSCGDVEWRKNSAGNEVLVRPCQTEHYAAQYQAYPPAIVPAADLGDFKLTSDTNLLVAYLPKGKHTGHVVETEAFTGETNAYGRRIFKRVLFRGLPGKDAKPGYP